MNKGSMNKATRELNVEKLMFSYGGAKVSQIKPISASSLIIRDNIGNDNINLFSRVLTGSLRSESPLLRILDATHPDIDLLIAEAGYLRACETGTETPTGLHAKQYQIENLGVGSNPLLFANNASQVLDVTGNVLVSERISWKDGTAFYAQLVHDVSANRLFTFPDSSLTLGLQNRGLKYLIGEIVINTNAYITPLINATTTYTSIGNQIMLDLSPYASYANVSYQFCATIVPAYEEDIAYVALYNHTQSDYLTNGEITRTGSYYPKPQRTGNLILSDVELNEADYYGIRMKCSVSGHEARLYRASILVFGDLI